MIITILTFLIVLAVLVLAHEWGHFIAAKKSGMQVEEFGFGFPPRLWSFKGKDGVTYSVNWIPLGGFVKILGESGSHQNHSGSFSSKPMWKRFIVLFAGVGMNFILAAVLLSAGYMVGLPSAIDDGLPTGAKVENQAVEIFGVAADSPAGKASLPSGTLMSIDGQMFTDAKAAREYIGAHGDTGVRLDIKTGEDTRSFSLKSDDIPSAGVRGIGVLLGTTGTVSLPPHRAVMEGVLLTGWFTKEIVFSFADLLKNIVVNQKVSADLSGPVGIAVMTGQVARAGFAHLLQFMAILSINLAVINVLPFPALDGGRILFLVIEKLRGKPASATVEAVVHNLGFMLLMILVVLVTYKDIVRYAF